jgi:hypothetical protein
MSAVDGGTLTQSAAKKEAEVRFRMLSFFSFLKVLFLDGLLF